MEDIGLSLRDKLNLETASVSWHELALFFARGRVIEVKNGLDLVEVAAALTSDNTVLFSRWIEIGSIRHLPDATARAWVLDDSHLWAVVVAPWVLVQDRR
ncbi:MAG: DUF2288 domain-containing protein [Thiothrix sp.]|nr:DUF2288 domain-containing protein [Thiothrix sp.]HPQ94358.1 DUF2288 domain-containing protein [Thiolinea sp.]